MSLVSAGFAVDIPEFLNELGPVLLGQGAEALTFKINHPEVTGKFCVAKYRPPKPYRIPELDQQLRKKRTSTETKVLKKLNAVLIPCPKYIKSDDKSGLILMEYIDGITLKEYTYDSETPETDLVRLYTQLGHIIANMHELNVTHGDLTTSNVLVAERELAIIDFGLSFMSGNVEDKATDIYVLERAIMSTHSSSALDLAQLVLQGYDSGFKDRGQYQQIMSRLDTVRQRGRKRSMLG